MKAEGHWILLFENIFSNISCREDALQYNFVFNLAIFVKGKQIPGQICNLGVRCCCFVAKSCLTLCDPVDCKLLGSSVHSISQARILKRVAISLSRGPSRPRDRTHVSVSCIFFLMLQGFYFIFNLFIFLISWRLITLQYCSGFCHTLT